MYYIYIYITYIYIYIYIHTYIHMHIYTYTYKGGQSWVFIGRTVAEAETPILWLPHVKS